MLEVRLGSKYTLSTELLLYRLGQSNKSRRKSKKKFSDIQQMITHCPKDVFSRSPRGRPENVLGTSRINLPGTSLGREIRMSPGCHFGSPQDVRSGRPRNGSRGRPGDVGGGGLRDVLGTNIFWLGN